MYLQNSFTELASRRFDFYTTSESMNIIKIKMDSGLHSVIQDKIQNKLPSADFSLEDSDEVRITIFSVLFSEVALVR